MADRFSEGSRQLAEAQQQADNDAAPRGLQQQARANASGVRENRFAQGSAALQPWLPKDYTQNAQGWYTGANTQGQANGWSTDFTAAYNDGWNSALEQGTAADYFRDGGTGIVLWDHQADDGRTFAFGDVVEQGQVVSNVYKDFDRTTANLMLLPWIDDGTVQRRLWEDAPGEAEVANRVEQFVSAKHEENNTNLEKALGAMEFSGDVAKTREDFQAGSGDELLAGGGGAVGGAATGASAGAAIGAFFGGVGAIPGAIIGGAIGGVAGAAGGLMNKDEIAEAAARSYETYKLSRDEQNPLATTGQALQGIAQVGMKLTSPLQNLTRGATDVWLGEAGDGVSERYAVDKRGESKVPTILKVADWTSLVGDSLLQFASPLNRAIYTAQMGTMIGGEVMSLAASGGQVFDPREGGFDNIFVDDKGHADPTSAMAGIAKIGIDVVQLGGVRGLARQSDRAGAAVAGHAQPLEAAGHRFIMNEAGQITGAKKTMALLAPSEQIAWASAARSARVAAMKDGRAVTADDFYRAANNLANGSSKLKTAVVNAFGEGYEEFAQAILEPVSTDGNVSGKEAATAFLYGAAAGLGMSAGATFQAPTNDARMLDQAYALETLRRDGAEPDFETFKREWKDLDPTEKRVRATRTPADVAATAAAQQVINRNHAATLVATEQDAAKALDSRRAALDSALKSATTRTDAYQVMAGLVDVGRVDADGALLGDTAPAEAVEASARTIHGLLANRLEGMAIQEQFLGTRLAELDPADPKHAETAELLAHVARSRAFGESFVADVQRFVDAIYAPGTTEAQAQAITRDLNRLLYSVFDRTANLTIDPADPTTPGELAEAAAHFVSLIQSREPKLDTGSYLALLPRASWRLTRDGSDNFLQVNTDILQAINGDFDGDKLRAENQLVLSPERFAQARGGQNFGGAGRELDIATRNFDEQLTVAVAQGLKAAPGALRDEADAAMDAIENALRIRYGRMMSPEAWTQVFDAFRTAVHAGSKDARLTLLNGLAREAGESITNLGKDNLRNEWLWASKIIRANFNAYQTQYRMLRNLDSSGNVINAPSDEIAAADFDTPEGTQLRKSRASTDAQTLSLYAAGTTLFRQFQKIHYTWYNSAVLGTEEADRADLFEAAKVYEELAQNVTEDELSRVGTDDTVAARVLVMLSRLVDSALATEDVGEFNPQAAMAIFANIKVRDVWFDGTGPVEGQGDMTMVQVLLKRALDADREEHKLTFDVDEKLQAKHASLRALTIPNSSVDEVNAERAFYEVFKAVPFRDSLGGNTGALGMHTTPEQWMRNYIANDANGRQDIERLYTNVPEYLDRKERSNIPYSLDEAKRKEVTPYRSMLDSMLAVGRSELTFDPSKPAAEAFGGRRARIDRGARTDFIETHQSVRDAMRSLRQIQNRSRSDRAADTALVQEMLAANPQQGRAILDLVPNAAANALYEYRDGELYVVPWVYEMFAIEDADAALFFYWKNLVLARWNSIQVAGRRYDSLQTRFDRLMYQLAAEPGQLHLEQLVRKMDSAQSLDEFFLWLNITPGYRGQQAPLLPFVDDVADFEADAAGGWVTVKESSDLRASISSAKTAARQLSRTMAFREDKMATDRTILDGIMRARSGDPAATDLDRDNLRKLEKTVAIARELPRGFSPAAMLALTRGVVRGFDAHSHDKGQTATSYEEVGQFQALMDAFGFVPGLERVMETLTAHSIGSLRTNLGDLARTSGTAMDANGRPIGWESLSVDQAIEMLDDPRTAPLAHALLTPTAMDLSPVGLTERLLMDASLKDLLDNDHYKDLFRTDAQNQLAVDTEYLSMLDMKARAEGGHFDAIRAANDLAIALTSGLGKKATAEDEDRLTAQAYHHVATIMRMVGQVQATPDMRNAGMLETLRETALKELRSHRQSRALPGFTDRDTGEVMKDWVQTFINDLEAELVTAKADLANRYQGNDLARRVNEVVAQHEQNKQRINAMLDDNLLQTVTARFELAGDPALDQPQRARIAEFVTASTNFPARAPEAAAAWTKLAGQRLAGITPDLTETEWDTLSRAAIGVTLVDDLLRVATHVAIPSLPKRPEPTADNAEPTLADARFYKYLDPSYTYLATDLLDENSPLTRAAVWLHTAAEQPRQAVSISKLERVLYQTMLDREALGPWTPGMMAQQIEAQTRMDSAGAPPGIAAAGNGPKRWAAVAAATRRTGMVPPPELLTTVTFTADFLAEDTSPFSEISVQPAGATEASSMPVAQLENRFYSSIKLNGEELNLDADNLGFEWDGADEDSPYRYVSLERLRPLVARYAAANNIPASQVQVEATFFHPDSAPAGVWNNAFFEGMSHSLLPDGSESLIATLWSDNGGRISRDTQWTIDAGKKGLRAIMPFRPLPADKVLEAESLWDVEHDMAAMLRRKAELVARYDDGSGAAGVEAFNALFKIMKLQHIVVGTNESGEPVAWTADQVIAFQAANGKAADLPIAGGKLVKLSADVLRTMLGETGDQGVARFFEDEYLINPDLVSPYEGIDERTLSRFVDGWLADTGRISDTSLAHIGQQRVMRVRTVMPASERNARSERKIYLDKRAADARAARYGRLKDDDARKTYVSVLQTAMTSVSTERTPFDFGGMNSGVIGPRNVVEAEHTLRLLETFNRVKDAKGLERGWVVRDEGVTDYPGGALSLESLHDDRDAEHWVVKDDLALVELNSFQRPERKPDVVEARVEKALDFLANSGAYVVLGSGNGEGDLRYFASKHLESRGYVRIEGSRHLYGPAEFVYQTQNERAYESTLMETKRIRPAKQAITFMAIDPIETDENDAILNPASTKLRDRKLVANLLPSTKFPHFNIPTEDNRGLAGLYGRTLNHLRTMVDPANPEYRDALVKMAGQDPSGVMPIEDALDRFHRKITQRASLEPEVGESIEVGDIIPFVHPNGQVILYRHGMKAPKPRDLAKLFATDGMNVALAKSETDALATANSGRITNIEDRTGYGKRLVLEVPLQPHGDKVQLEWNGMKYILVPAPDSFGTIPPLFRNGMVVDLFSDVKSADSKEAFEGRVVGYRDALAFFQFDFHDDLVEFFYPGSKPTDGDFATKRIATYDLLHRLSNQDQYRIPFSQANAIAKANIAIGQMLGDFAAAEAARSDVPADWADRLQDTTDATSLIARAMITYLLTPGANVDNVLKSAGFSHPRALDPAVESRQVPGLFADLLDGPLDGELHTELIRRFDGQLLRGADGSGFKLHPDWTVEMFDDKGRSLKGYLQYGEAHSSGDNPVLDGQAFDSTERAAVSPHNAMAASLSFGAVTAHEDLEKYKAFARSFTRTGEVSKFGEDGDSVWHMLTALPDEKDLGLAGWRREQPAETVRRALAREELVGFYQPLDTTSWDETTNQAATFRARAVNILHRMNLHGAQTAMVDSWIRDHLGRPYGLDELGNDLSVISFEDAMQVLAKIEGNIREGRLPHAGAALPLMDVNHLTTLYMRNMNLPAERRWAPKEDGLPLESWDDWVNYAFGTAWIMAEGQDGVGPEPQFHQMFLLAADGRMHGYQNATSSTRYLPVSSDTLRQRMLVDADTNRMLVSLSADENLLATDPTLWNSTSSELEDILAGQRIYAPGRSGPDPASAHGKSEARRNRWHRETGAPRQVNKRMRGVRESGQAFVGYTTTTNGFFRSMMNLRVGNTLFNLQLAVSAPFEAMYRRQLNLFANVLTGEATGAVGQAQTWLSDKVASTKAGALAEQFGFVTTYTGEQQKRLNTLVDALSTLPEFKAMIYKELMFQYPTVAGIGHIEKWLERYAKFGARMQDPAWGMLPKDLARIYVETAMRRNAADPTGENVFSINRLLTELPRNPDWLKSDDLETHNMAIAAVANVRSVKPNVLSLWFRGWVEPLSENPKFIWNSAGNTLKVLTAFQNFWANFGTTITGLQGPVDFMAFWLDGKEKKLTARAQRAIRGDKTPPTEAEYFDMSEVLESIDLADSFIRGGVTHTALFALGMMAGGLGLSGEDDEMKLRRRQAELQGVPVLHDPRDLEADFRNKDSLYLDWLPFGWDSMFRVDPTNPDSRAMVQMNWVTRTFLSPIIGFERFYNTGDFSEIIHGFKDAVGSHPIVNQQLWSAATDTAAYLHAQSVDAAEKGDVVESSHLLMTAVGVLEGMLFENSMTNLIYVGRDEWDRDPYVQTLKDSEGTIQRDIEGQPRENDVALQSFIDPTTGKLRTGYLGRSQEGSDFRVLTENKATMALIASLFTGGIGDSDYWRYNMAIKTREIEKPEVTQDEAEAYVKAAAAYQLSLLDAPNISAEELKPQVATAMYDAAKAAGTFDPNMDAHIWAAARELAARKGSAAMSVLADDGHEKLTDAGARALYEGLRHGTIQLDSPDMAGVYIPYEMRQKIAAEWTKEIVQDGINMGLDETKAKSRMMRLMQGGFDSPEASSAGLSDILFDRRIPMDATQTYGQLNTSYVMGPDGRPWATGFKRGGLLEAIGMRPVRTMTPPRRNVTGTDIRGNTVDLVNGMNTGLRSLVPFDDSRNIPTDDEIGKAIVKAIEDAKNSTYTPMQPFEKKGGSGYGNGWQNYGRRGYGGYGGGGGGGGYFSKMYSMPHQQSPYGSSAPFINTSNPILRRAFVRRERISSDRGRLNQWQ